VHVQTSLITSSKFAQWWPPIPYPNSLSYSLQVATIFATMCISNHTPVWPPSESVSYSILASKRNPEFFNVSLQVHHQTHLITATRDGLWKPKIASPNSADRSLQIDMIMTSKWFPTVAQIQHPSASLSYLISASKYMSILAKLQPPSGYLSYLITASMCIPRIARSQTPSASLSLPKPQPPRVSATHSTMFSIYISKFTWQPPPAERLYFQNCSR